MKPFILLAAFFAMSCGAVEAAPARGGSTAIAVEGDYVYVVENGAVYKLSARDLKPVARTVLPTRSAAKNRRTRRRTISSSARRTPRAMRRNARKTVRPSNANRNAARRAPATKPMPEAPLPPI